jgi:hypothetical protein
MSLSACDSAKPAETASPSAHAGASATTGVVNKSSAAKAREEDRKIDGP